jgi:hypothetical protein
MKTREQQIEFIKGKYPLDRDWSDLSIEEMTDRQVKNLYQLLGGE